MTLTKLLQELKEVTNDKKVSGQKAKGITGSKIALPQDFDVEEDTITFKDLNYRGGESPPLYHLRISGFPERTLDEVQPILGEFFTRARNLRFNKNAFGVKYGIFWTPDSFQNERKLDGFFSGKVVVNSRVYPCDPNRIRIGNGRERHTLNAETEGNRMTLSAEGNYKNGLRMLIKEHGIQVAKLNLSREDAEKLIRVMVGKPFGRYIKSGLERALQPKSVLSFGVSHGAVNVQDIEIIEISVPTRFLDNYEQVLGKPLLSSNHETRVTELTKFYGLGGLLGGERLSDLQSITREISTVDLGLVYEHPMVTNADARILLDKEIETIRRGYQSFFTIAQDHPALKFALERLVREHFGDEILMGLDDHLGIGEYINFLKGKEYIKVDVSPNDYFSGPKKDQIEKEMHLLEFFKKSYEQNPFGSLQKFRCFYQNSPPKIDVYATAEKDASRLRRIKIPSQSRLYEFKITENSRFKGHSNDLSITRTFPSYEKIHFWSRTSVDSPTLLPLQEHICGLMGITFK